MTACEGAIGLVMAFLRKKLTVRTIRRLLAGVYWMDDTMIRVGLTEDPATGSLYAIIVIIASITLKSVDFQGSYWWYGLGGASEEFSNGRVNLGPANVM